MKRLVIELDDLRELNEAAPAGEYLNIGVQRSYGTLENLLEKRKQEERLTCYFSSLDHPADTSGHFHGTDGPLLGYRVRDIFVVDVEES